MSASAPGRKLLVVNSGSSSLRVQLFALEGERRLDGASVERIGEPSAPDHRHGLEQVTARLRERGALGGASELAAVGHRVVHGGEEFAAPVRIDARVRDAIRALAELAPLHNPANLAGIDVCLRAFPDVPQVAVFDTAFHQTLPPRAYRYAVPEEWRRRFGVRRYGFHGISHRYVAERAAELLARPFAELRLITLHLGNGASAAAIAGGRSVDTSMGLTPLEGLVMGTRSGDLDPAAALHVQRAGGLSVDAVDEALNHASGLRALAGTNDVRELLAREQRGDPDARLALELYAYRIKKYLGAYTAVLGRADAVVFTGGVGENAARVRGLACAGLETLGIALDEGANARADRRLAEIGRTDAPVRVLVVPTDEELQIARETLAVLRAPAVGSS